MLNGSSRTLFDGYDDVGGNNQSGSISVDVEEGNIFGFEVFSIDGVFGAAFLTISSLVTPEPPDTGDATYSITGQTYAGKTLTAGVSANDTDCN